MLFRLRRRLVPAEKRQLAKLVTGSHQERIARTCNLAAGVKSGGLLAPEGIHTGTQLAQIDVDSLTLQLPPHAVALPRPLRLLDEEETGQQRQREQL